MVEGLRIQALRRLRNEDSKFKIEVNLGYSASSRPTYATWDPVSTNKKRINDKTGNIEYKKVSVARANWHSSGYSNFKYFPLVYEPENPGCVLLYPTFFSFTTALRSQV